MEELSINTSMNVQKDVDLSRKASGAQVFFYFSVQLVKFFIDFFAFSRGSKLFNQGILGSAGIKTDNRMI
ncbi:MAG: hypothetical protein A3D96_07365 [Chlamydiae bacterium RIFCSPHIGHO2_12_FULL_44_59]|nr:MAG: hypothetical protein A3C42_02460 [Chlamydiae bacterium RIFCSPHIGHO2_02_FULL_45_9]OGN56853.1 MAG: hypothetical protein A2796_06675 [Chlamydiae bacterium RIFCSPHIGHO2_01_FULL_44_39]OGN59511.1 MAG: hypothetical protein A3D96_07365 [Chlamydiae bacterium RIFCSPHIGHO2_12_FULL_44_59]OGN67256.1 MAG: hypothetical protein A2978_03195 [Chlamydiae bacterium RIFCSPLOWO2_01_FULL_44_52]OGN68678.1 MAG: hypothetical protein A3I67_02925 [Chlamydiae bacterium RIFCSPLOWO2_02_FULL_45_22]OGN69199.1 MAG: hyp